MPVGLFGLVMNISRRARGDGGGHGVEVVAEIGVRHLDDAGVEKLRHQCVNGEGVAGGDHLIAGAQKGVTDELDDLRSSRCRG